MSSRLAWTAATCLAAAVLTGLSIGLNRWVAQPTGLVRSFYAGVEFTGEPRVRQTVDDISLDFLNTRSDLPKRFFGVRWEGFWFLPRRQAVEVYAGGDDEVRVWINGDLVLSRSLAEGMHTIGRDLTLEAGPHEIVVEHKQYLGAFGLNVQWAPAGDSPRSFRSAHLFPHPVGAKDFWMTRSLTWLEQLVIPIWLVPAAAFLLWRGRQRLPVARPAEARAVRRRRDVGCPPTLRQVARRGLLVTFPALLGPAVLFFLGPHTIYASNPGEFSVPFRNLAPWLLALVVASWALLLAVGLLLAVLSERLTRTYAALLFALGVLCWVQGNLLVADYGLLSGESLDLTSQAWRAPYELGLWVGGLGLAAVFARTVATVAPLASQLFLGLQAIVLTISIASPGKDDYAELTAWTTPPEQIYQLSHDRNVIHIVLDAFLSETFGELIEQERATFDRDFSGFVFFADHLGAFPTTRASMPAMLSGIAYRNEMPFDEFMRTTSERSVFSILARRGYQIDSITFHGRQHPPASLPGGENIVRFTIPTPYGSYGEYLRFALAEALDLSLFRHVPHGFKSRVYNEEAWLAQSWYPAAPEQAARNARPSNHAAFLEELAHRLGVVRHEPVYKLIHVAIPHLPIVVDAECAFIGPQSPTQRRYAAQARCALALVQRLLDRLRDLDAYDRSVIVLTSDHGWSRLEGDHPFDRLRTPAGNMAVVARGAMPLLAVKPAGGSGPLRTSHAPTAITDIPATILDLLGLPHDLLPGEPAFRLESSAGRRRTYAHHSWANADWLRPYFDVLHVFSIDGPVLEPGSWTFEEAIFAPKGGQE